MLWKCTFLSVATLNVLPHIEQAYGVTSWCIFLCFDISPCDLNSFPHSEQEYGLSPVCVLLWILYTWAVGNILPQTSQGKGLNFSCTLSIWSFKFDTILNVLSHIEQPFCLVSIFRVMSEKLGRMTNIWKVTNLQSQFLKLSSKTHLSGKLKLCPAACLFSCLNLSSTMPVSGTLRLLPKILVWKHLCLALLKVIWRLLPKS